jgi:uncharacterized pyridoxamine 5'-phosphate oxidase family protein
MKVLVKKAKVYIVTDWNKACPKDPFPLPNIEFFVYGPRIKKKSKESIQDKTTFIADLG